MMHFATTAVDLAPVWEVTKGVALFAITSFLAWISKAMSKLLEGQRDTNHFLRGVDGDGGMKAEFRDIKTSVRLLHRRVDEIDARFIAIDAVEEADRQMHPGPDRRHVARRTLDQLHRSYDTRDAAAHHPPPDEDESR